MYYLKGAWSLGVDNHTKFFNWQKMLHVTPTQITWLCLLKLCTIRVKSTVISHLIVYSFNAIQKHTVTIYSVSIMNNDCLVWYILEIIKQEKMVLENFAILFPLEMLVVFFFLGLCAFLFIFAPMFNYFMLKSSYFLIYETVVIYRLIT